MLYHITCTCICKTSIWTNYRLRDKSRQLIVIYNGRSEIVLVFYLPSIMSEWLLFNANSAIFQHYHSENILLFLWRWWCPFCTRLSWLFIVLAHWNNSPRIDMSLHSDTLFWFTANQSLLFLLSATCLEEKHQILSVFWPERGSNQRSPALEARTLTITPSKRFWTQQNINTYVLSVSMFAKLIFIQLLLIFDCI